MNRSKLSKNLSVNNRNVLKQWLQKGLTAEKIELHLFHDVDLDVSGWYTWGHHHPAAVLRAFAKSHPASPRQLLDVQIGWASSNGQRFEFSTRPLSGFQPVTVIERLV